MKIIVYSKHKGFCPRCKMTKKWLKGHNVKFQDIDVESNNNADLVKKHGYTSAPVVEANNWKISFSGFRPASLAKLAKLSNSKETA